MTSSVISSGFYAPHQLATFRTRGGISESSEMCFLDLHGPRYGLRGWLRLERFTGSFIRKNWPMLLELILLFLTIHRIIPGVLAHRVHRIQVPGLVFRIFFERGYRPKSSARLTWFSFQAKFLCPIGASCFLREQMGDDSSSGPQTP